MPLWVLVVVPIILVALAALCVVNARAIRRDIDERFDKIQRGLEDEANDVVRRLLNDDESVK